MFWWIFWIMYGLAMIGWMTFWGRTLPGLRAELKRAFDSTKPVGIGYTRTARIERQNYLLLLHSLNWALVLCAPLWPVLLVFLLVDDLHAKATLRAIVKGEF